MILYGIIQQTSDDIRCHSIYTSKKKRDKCYEVLEKEQNDNNLFYKFTKTLNDMGVRK